MNKWCKWLGHKWERVYVGYDGKEYKWQVITCYCERCRYGYKDLLAFSDIMKYDFCTYSQKYFDKARKV